MEVKYVASLDHVEEVSLLGTADLDYWRRQLEPVELLPAQLNGRAQILISATASRYCGVRFRELCIGILTCEREGRGSHDGVFLPQAFNSSRLFAFFERTCFSTPYEHGKVELSSTLPVAARLAMGGTRVFSAEMSAGAPDLTRSPIRDEPEDWEGPIYLPRSPGGKGRPGKVFHARLGGPTRTFEFAADIDLVSIEPQGDRGALGQLLESGFTGKEWKVRGSARHARSRTFARKPG